MGMQKQAKRQHDGKGDSRGKHAIWPMHLVFRGVLHLGGRMNCIPDRFRSLNPLQRRYEPFAKPDFLHRIPATAAVRQVRLNSHRRIGT
jgi:hypothetical protein